MAAVLPSWLDKEFAESSLRARDGADGPRVLSVAVERATSPGDNYLSEVYRMRLELEDGSPSRRRTASLIVKTAPDGEVMRQMAEDMRAFEHETLMFTETLPALARLLRAPGRCTRLSARCVASGRQPVAYLVLEDLTAAGCSLARRQSGLDLPHALAVVRKLARLHAASAALLERSPTQLDAHQRFLMFSDGIADNVDKFVKTGMLQVAHQLEALEEAYAKYAPKLRALAEDFVVRLKKLTSPKEGQFRVLNHADCWVNNLMFKYCDGSVEDVVLLDFQLSSLASPAVDLQYFTHTSLNEKVYTNNLEELLKEYHRHLVEIMSDLGLSAEKHISYEELLDEFNKHTLYGMFAAVGVLPIVRTEDKTRFEVEALFDESESSSNKNTYASASYIRALKLMLPEFEKKGFL